MQSELFFSQNTISIRCHTGLKDNKQPIYVEFTDEIGSWRTETCPSADGLIETIIPADFNFLLGRIYLIVNGVTHTLPRWVFFPESRSADAAYIKSWLGKNERLFTNEHTLIQVLRCLGRTAMPASPTLDFIAMEIASANLRAL